MKPITIGSRLVLACLTATALVLGWGCVAPDDSFMDDRRNGDELEGAAQEESFPPGTSEVEQRRTSEELALRLDTLTGEGPYLTDGHGRALYVREGGAGDMDSCDDACQQQWPAFTVSSGQPEPQGGVQQGLISSLERPGEMIQITYADHPLYFYHDDDSPGDTKGQGVSDSWGHWYLITPEGEPLETPEGWQQEGGATANLEPTEGNDVEGTVRFIPSEDGGVHVEADIIELVSGAHGFHVHENGDCSAPDGSSAGDHFAPEGSPHGAPMNTASERHVGDLGNVEANSDGVAEYARVDEVLTLEGPNSIVGRAVIVHAGEDDLSTQPDGGAGPRVACGVIATNEG